MVPAAGHPALLGYADRNFGASTFRFLYHIGLLCTICEQ